MKIKKPKLPNWLEKIFHHSQAPIHATYFGLVSWESGHLYGIAAFFLLLITLAEMLDDHGA